jgi:hypothetical protein
VVDQPRRPPEALGHPPRIDRDEAHEQREREHEVHHAQHLDDLVGRAAVEIVDVQHDPAHRRRRLVGFVVLGGRARHQLR